STASATADQDEQQLDEGTMSFLDHLDELRSRLIRCAIFVAVAFVLCWLLSDRIYRFLEVPVKAAMIEAKLPVLQPVECDVAPLSDYIGQQIIFTFPIETKIGKALVQAGTTVRAQVKRADDNSLQLVTVDPWIINESTVVKEGCVIPQNLYQSATPLSADN